MAWNPDPRGDTLILPATHPKVFVKLVAAAGTPERIISTDLMIRRASLYGQKDLSRTSNAGSVFIGASNSQPQQIVPFDPSLPGGEVIIACAENDPPVNLHDYWLDSQSSGDGVVVIIHERA